MNNILKEIKFRLLDNKGNISSRKYYSKANTELKKQIEQYTSFLPIESTASERIYCIQHNIKDRQICKYTGKYLKFSPNKKQYHTTATYKRPKSNSTIKKLKDTKKHNHQATRQHFWETYQQSSYEILSVDIIKGFIIKFKQIHKNLKVELLQKYTNELCNVIRLTDIGFLQGRYELHNLGERMYLIHHDMFSAPCCYDDPTKKAPYVNFNVGYRKQSSNIARIVNINNKIKQVIEDQGFTIVNSDKIFNLKDCNFILQCNTCKKQLNKHLTNGRWQNIYCSGCYGDKNRSFAEQEISDFILTHNANIVVKNNLKISTNKKEFDIFIPSLNTAIEYNGILWHSFGTTYPNNYSSYKHKKYHLRDKWDYCKNNNITLISIFENEWLLKKDIVKSMLLAKLNLIPTQNRLYARTCKVVKLTPQDKKQFLTDNHIQVLYHLN